MSNLPPQAEPTVDDSGRKVWKVGTLTYTIGGLIGLFCLLLWGDLTASMRDRSVGPVFQVLMHKFGASDFVFGLVAGSLASAINLILSPIVAYRSDRHRGPHGRRLPYLLWSTPFIALSMAGLGFSPMLGTWLHTTWLHTAWLHTEWLRTIWLHLTWSAHAPTEDACVLIVLTFFWVTLDIAGTVGGAVFNGLLNDVVPPEVLGRFFGFWRAISLMAGIIFNFWLMNRAAELYFWIYIGMAIFFGFGFMFMLLRVKEGEYPPPPPPEAHGALSFFFAAKNYLIECFTLPYYWLYFAATICAGLAAVPINTFMIPFAASLNLSDHFGNYLGYTYCISLVLAYPLGALVDRTHPLPLFTGVLFLYAVGTFIGGFYCNDPRYYGYALIVHGVLSGTYGTIGASLSMRLLPRSTFAQFSAAAGILNALCFIVIPPGIGALLDHWHHAYRFTFFLSSGFAMLATVLLFWLYLEFLRRGGPKGYVAPDRHAT